MPQNVHGHAILDHIVKAGGAIALSELSEFAASTYGADATYYTCSASKMSFDQLVEFLVSRNKVTVRGANVTVHVENMCNHHEADGAAAP